MDKTTCIPGSDKNLIGQKKTKTKDSPYLNRLFWFSYDSGIPDICHIFTLAYFEAWKFYTQTCVNSQEKLPRDQIA